MTLQAEETISDESLDYVIRQLAERFGEMPTEDEVMDFIFGDIKKRHEIWNSRR